MGSRIPTEEKKMNLAVIQFIILLIAAGLLVAGPFLEVGKPMAYMLMVSGAIVVVSSFINEKDRDAFADIYMLWGKLLLCVAAGIYLWASGSPISALLPFGAFVITAVNAFRYLSKRYLDGPRIIPSLTFLGLSVVASGGLLIYGIYNWHIYLIDAGFALYIIFETNNNGEICLNR